MTEDSIYMFIVAAEGVDNPIIPKKNLFHG
jgi:hypothetical protein